VLIFAIWAFHRTVFSSERVFKSLEIVSPISPALLFDFTTNILLLFVINHWQPNPTVVWSLRGPIYGIAQTLYLGLYLLYMDLALILLFIPANRKLEQPMQDGPFAYIRHPIPLVHLLSLWLVPYMTVGHLTWTVVFTVYILFDCAWNEHRLTSQFGHAYEEYRKKTYWFDDIIDRHGLPTHFAVVLFLVLVILVKVVYGLVN